jgi:hypothetical protein
VFGQPDGVDGVEVAVEAADAVGDPAGPLQHQRVRAGAGLMANVPSAVLRTRTVTSAWWLARHGKAADSEQILVEDHYCSGHEVFSDLIKVGENDRCLLRGPASDEAADEDH